MIETTHEVLSPRIVAQKPPFHDLRSNGVTHYATLQSEVLEPMLQELSILEESLAGSEKAAVSAYRVEMARFAADAAAKVAAAS